MRWSVSSKRARRRAKPRASCSTVPLCRPPRRLPVSDPRRAPRGPRSLDDAGAQAGLDNLISALSFETAARQVILPYLREIGERWQRGEATVAQEHFATTCSGASWRSHAAGIAVPGRAGCSPARPTSSTSSG